MIPNGNYVMARGWMDHPTLKEPVYCRRAAWCWLIEEACWKPRKRNIAGHTHHLMRGQLTASTRFLAQAWGWSEAKVRRYLTRLKTDALIDAASDAGQNVITILNYDVYQLAPGYRDAAIDAAGDAGATQQRRRSDANENTGNTSNTGNAPQGAAAPKPPPVDGLDGEVLPPVDGLVDPAKAFFDDNLPVLTAKGVPAKQARGLLAMWRRDYGDERTRHAISEARLGGASEPISFIASILKKPRGAANGRGRRSAVLDGLDDIFEGGQHG